MSLLFQDVIDYVFWKVGGRNRSEVGESGKNRGNLADLSYPKTAVHRPMFGEKKDPLIYKNILAWLAQFCAIMAFAFTWLSYPMNFEKNWLSFPSKNYWLEIPMKQEVVHSPGVEEGCLPSIFPNLSLTLLVF